MTGGRSQEESPAVLILGGGYAGISTVVGLKGSGLPAVLVNQNPFHYFTTLLHQPAAGHADFQHVSLPIQQLLGPSTRLVEGTVTEIDLERRAAVVALPTGDEATFQAPRLVIALGSEPQFYNIVGLEEHGLTLHSLHAAQLIRAHIQLQLARYADQPQETWRPHVIVGGGGWSGVELAGELADWRPQVTRRYGVEAGAMAITIVEAADTLLHGFDPVLIRETEAILARKGIQVMLSSPIAETYEEGVLLADERELKAGTVIWTGGIRGRRVVEQSGLEVDRQGRVHVDRHLRAHGHENIFVLGDSARSLDDDGSVLPATAQIAVQHGQHMARMLRQLHRGRSLDEVEPFHAHQRGTFLSIGQREALGLLPGNRRVYGTPARWIKEFAAYQYVASIGGFGLAVRKWLQRMMG